MLRINKLVPSSVVLNEEVVESYQGGIEVFHQIHCLDMLRKLNYPDYYHSEVSIVMQRIHTGKYLQRIFT
jgi:hypothetical protein